MGWWSHDIMGGDSPLDFEDEIFGICNVEKFPASGGYGIVTAENLKENFDKIISMIEQSRSEKNIGYQVLAVMMMRSGFPIPESLHQTLEDACHTDEWAAENEQRKEAIDGLLAALKAYDNVNPIQIRSKGLFEVITEKFNNQ